MRITESDKLAVLARVLMQIPKLPSLKLRAAQILCPVDSVRYTEFAYLFKAMERFGMHPHAILDVSSPFIMSYLLAGRAKVIKTDIDETQSLNIATSGNPTFKREDARSLTFNSNCFDLVYSISVIEHIYEKYSLAVSEMLRVLKPGGYLYLTFPVAKHHVEEWTEKPVYSDQQAREGRFFFQYRFGEQDVTGLLEKAAGCDVEDVSIFWERHDGEYDRAMSRLRQQSAVRSVDELRRAALNLYTGFTLLENKPANFFHARSFGNASLLIRKR